MRAGDAVTDMSYFTARDGRAASYCEALVQGCDIYVGIIGLRYGSPVRDRPELSYTELEFDVATKAGKPRLIFLLDEDVAVPIPPGRLLDRDMRLHERQLAFRKTLRECGVMVATFARSEQLELLLLHALQETRSEQEGAGGHEHWSDQTATSGPTFDDQRIYPSRPMLRLKRVTENGGSYEIEIFDIGIAEKWITRNLLEHSDWIEPVDE